MSGVYMNLRIIFCKSLCNPTPSDQASSALRSETTDKNTYLHVPEKNKRIFVNNYYYTSISESLISVLLLDLFLYMKIQDLH